MTQIIYEFGEFRLNPSLRELRHTKTGKRCTIVGRPKVFDLLLYLVKNHARAIENSELYDGGSGDQNARLRQLFAGLYKGLGDTDREHPRYIERIRTTTRFIMNVQEIQEIPPPDITGIVDRPSYPCPPLIDGRFYYIISRATNLALDVPEGDMATRQIHLWPAPGRVYNQLWQVRPTDNGFFGLLARHSDKCLDVNGAFTECGTILNQYQYEGNLNQQWKVESTPEGFSLVIARHSEKQCLDRDHLGFGSGAKLQMWNFNKWPNQEWDFVWAEHLLLGQHFVVDGRLTNKRHVAGVAHLLGLLIELSRRRATFYCLVDTGSLAAAEVKIISELRTKFPANFGVLPRSNPNEMIAAFTSANPAATLITTVKEASVLRRMLPPNSELRIALLTDDLHIPSLEIEAKGGNPEFLADIVGIRLTPAWECHERTEKQAEKHVAWHKMKFGDELPSGALVGGHEADGTPLYVARAFWAGGLHPGKVVYGKCNIAFGDREVRISEYEVPIVSTGQWGSPEPGMATALIGGHEHGNPLILARAKHEGGIHPGKIVIDHCHIGFGGKVYTTKDFEVYNLPR